MNLSYHGCVNGGQFVREARRRSGLTQRQLALRAGVTQPTIARIESGQTSASFERIVALVRAAGFDLDVRVVPLDEDLAAMAERNLRRTPDERLDTLLAAMDLYGSGRQGRDDA
jgi:transcriptional regulator with XRE-family HTH domain